jgi:hypothetical protein
MKETEKAVAAAERNRDALTEKLAAAGSHHVELARIGTALHDAEAELARLEEQWLDLAAEAEQTS